MKIAIYSHSIPPAVDGVSRRMASLVQELSKDGHEVFLFTLEKDPQLPAAPSSNGPTPIRYVTLASTFLRVYPTKKVAAPILSNMMLVLNVMRREKPDVMHCTMDAISPFLMLACRINNVPVVGSVHTDLQELLSEVRVWPIVGFVTGLKEGAESRLLDSCATTSPSFKKKLTQRGVSADHVMETGVAVDLFRPGASNAEVRNRLTFGNPNGLLVVYVGRFGPEKRIEQLLMMCGSVDGVYLALVGDGAMGRWLSERHGSWTEQGNGRTRGGVFCRTGFLAHEDLAPVYATADVHVSCSHFETLGNTVLEAHACGTSVVVPKAQGFVDTVDHEEDGFLFDGMRLSEGAAFLLRLRDDRALCRKMGEQGRQKVQLQSPERVARHMLHWYRRTSVVTEPPNAMSVALKWLGSVASVIACAGMVLFVVTAWFLLNAGHGCTRNVIRYCQNTRNMLGNSSFFNKISNTYKALSSITVERKRR